jgi:hypothetical protein
MVTALGPKQVVSFDELLMSIVSENPIPRAICTLTPEAIQSIGRIHLDC